MPCLPSQWPEIQVCRDAAPGTFAVRIRQPQGDWDYARKLLEENHVSELTWDGCTVSLAALRLFAFGDTKRPFKAPRVRHLDGNVSNDDLENIEWRA